MGLPLDWTCPTGFVITFDDGYRDFFTEGFAILKQCGFKATVFPGDGPDPQDSDAQ